MLLKKSLNILISASLLFSTLAIPSSALASATTDTTNSTIPIPVGSISGCTENVTITGGRLHDVSHQTVGSDGNTLITTHVNYEDGSGVGETSGAVYRIVHQNNTESVLLGGPQSEFTFTLTNLLIGNGSAGVVHITIHRTINANGDVTAEVLNTTNECH